MRLSLDLKKSSKQQQNSKTVKETVLPIQAKQNLKHQEKLKPKHSQPYGYLPLELRRQASDEILVQPKTLGNHQQQFKGKAKKDDELVKYMSNLPGYLQCMEREEDIQGKALNVGVLDWSRLEKWKSSQKCIAARDGNNASLTSSNLSIKMASGSSAFSNSSHNKTLIYQSESHSSPCPRLNSAHDDRVSRVAKPSMQNSIRFRDFETVSKRSVDGQKKVPWTYKSFDRNNSDVNLERGKTKDLDQRVTSKVGNCSSNSRYTGMPVKHKKNVSAHDGEAKKEFEEKQEPDTKRETLDQKITSSMEALSSNLRHHDISFSSKEKKIVVNGKIKKGIEELQDATIDLSPQRQPGENENIVLLLPKKFSRHCSLEEPRTPLDKNLAEANRNSLLDGFPHEEVHFSESNSEIPHSCPLPCSSETNMEQCKMAHTATDTRGVELSSYASACLNNAPSMLSASENAEKSSIESTNGNVVETSKILDQDSTDLAARKGRHPSPNRRFSFSLSRMTRSFSFKESSDVPQLSSSYVSVKSGPVISKASAWLDNSIREKASGHNRARSSPLRRILDPLLKSKGASQFHSAEIDHPLKGSSNSFSFRQVNAIESLQDEKDKTSRIQALLQLTVRNGLPLFRFVVDNNSSILAATTNYLTSPGKSDSGCNYTFYSIDEIKKKSGSWINQGSKEKSCGYVYNVVGQMKVTSSSCFDMAGQNSICRYTVKESVLFGVELRQGDQGSPKFMPNRELAAVVLKMPSESLSHDRKKNDKDDDLMAKGFSYCMPENGCSCKLEENNHFNNATVILPGGIHGLPNKGVPSPLIHRWKYGGSCDCGGWDVGCRLRILSGEKRCHKIPRTSKTYLTPDHFELFVQVLLLLFS